MCEELLLLEGWEEKIEADKCYLSSWYVCKRCSSIVKANYVILQLMLFLCLSYIERKIVHVMHHRLIIRRNVHEYYDEWYCCSRNPLSFGQNSWYRLCNLPQGIYEWNVMNIRWLHSYFSCGLDKEVNSRLIQLTSDNMCWLLCYSSVNILRRKWKRKFREQTICNNY